MNVSLTNIQCCSGGGTRWNAFPHKISRGNGVPAKIQGDRGNGDTAAFPQWRLKSKPVTQFNQEQKTRHPASSECKRDLSSIDLLTEKNDNRAELASSDT